MTIKPELLKRDAYHYELPDELIAQYPLPERCTSKLLVVDKQKNAFEDRNFNDIKDYFNPGDVLVINTTKVIPARLFGTTESGKKIEILLVTEQLSGNKATDEWLCLVKPSKKFKIGDKINFGRDNPCGEPIAIDNIQDSPEVQFTASLLDIKENGLRLLKFHYQGDFMDLLDRYGSVPLPGYISRKAEKEDKSAYQTVYATQKGSVAAPTAGLHFTEELLQEIKDLGVIITEVILHVGPGTFRPVKTDDITAHQMHSEYCCVPQKTAEIINNAKKNGNKIVSVGTTTTRTLESFANNNQLEHGSKWTDIFIYPGKEIKIIDALITNFHMPESTLLMLVSAFGGYDLIKKAYRHAVEKKYRFFSYGDAMLIF